jgi:hypothetical protein
MLTFDRGFVLALDNIAKAVPAKSKALKPVRFVNGEPVFRFRVEAIRCGNYLTADGEAFTVTPATLQHWTDTFKTFRAKKIAVPVPSGTHFQVDAEHNRGDVIGLSNDGRSLWATVELIGKDAPRIAASNGVSIYAEPEWKGPDGADYEWPIRHLLLTPDPRIPGLKGFMPIAASNHTTFNVPVLRYKAMATATTTRRPARQPLALDGYGAADENGLGVPGVGDGAALPGDESSTAGDVNAEPGGGDLKSQIKTHFLDKAHTVLEDEGMEMEEKLEGIKELLTEMEGILEAFQDEKPKKDEGEKEPKSADEEVEPKGAAMSNAPRMPDLRKKLGCANAQLAQLTSRLRRTEIDGLFTEGKINRPQHERLLAQFCNPNHVALSLSNEAFGNSFDEAIGLLSQNEPGLYGEQTGVQAVPQKALALNGTALPNPYRENQAEADRQRAEDASFAAPSAQRVSKRK